MFLPICVGAAQLHIVNKSVALVEVLRHNRFYETCQRFIFNIAKKWTDVTLQFIFLRTFIQFLALFFIR
jgi:hypothetical protein